MCLNALTDTGCRRRARLARCFRIDVDAHECAEPTMGHGESFSERTGNDNERNNGDTAGGCDQCWPDHNDDHGDNTTCSCRQTNEANAKSDVCDVSTCIHEGARGPRIGYLSVSSFLAHPILFLLFFSGPEEMEDASDAIAEAREAEDADDDMSEQQSVIMRESAIYNPAPIPASTQNLSLMSETSRRASAIHVNEADSSTAELMPRTHTMENVLTRESEYSRDSADSADSTRPLSEVPSESPPDYETEQGHNAIQNPPGLSSSPEPSSEHSSGFTTASQASANANTANRRSVFRGFNLFNLGGSSNGANSSTQPPLSEEPRSSNLSSSPPDARTSTTTRHVRHRSSQSGMGSGSTFSVPFRTLSRQRSTTTLRSTPSRPNLTSPSALSINSISISAPLSHTLMRTEIRYPRGGPTPEQIKLISSRESLGRFGVPYGRDAIEHAQNSRLELALDPPPAFESPADEGGPSAARDEGEGEEMPEGHEDNDDRHEPSSSSNTAQRSRSHSTDRRSSPERRQDGDSTIPPRLLVPLFM